MTGSPQCPVCGRDLLLGDRPRGGRKPRYCSGACKAKAYRARQQEGCTPDAPPLPPGARHARALEIRQQISELAGIMADIASGQQALFTAPDATRRRARPTQATRTLHRLVTELATLAAATERVPKRQTPASTPPTMHLFDEADTSGQHAPRHPDRPPAAGLFREF